MANVSFTLDSQGQTQELRPSGLGGRSDERTGRRHGKEPEKMVKKLNKNLLCYLLL